MLTWNCDRPGCSAVEDAEWMRVEIDTSARRVRLHSPDWALDDKLVPERQAVR
jgi:hypothetical protein